MPVSFRVSRWWRALFASAVALAGIACAIPAVSLALPDAPVAEAQLTAPAPGEGPPATAVEYARQFGTSQAEAESRLAVQAKALTVIGEVKTALGSGYAGAWFDNTTGRLRVASVGAKAPSVIMQSASAHAIGSSTDVVPVKSTWNELEQAQAGVDAALKPAEENQELSTGLDPSHNAVIVRESSSAIGDVAQRVDETTATARGVSFEVQRVAPERLKVSPMIAECGWGEGHLVCYPPLRGGVTLRRADGAECSFGFTGYPPAEGSTQYVITAGHCIKGTTLGEKGTSWSSQTAGKTTWFTIGPSWGYQLNSTGDYGLVKIKPPSNWWPNNPGYWVLDTRPGGLGYQDALHHVVSGDAPGLYNCHTGESSLTTCGQVLSVHNSFCYSEGAGCPGFMTEDSFGSIPGDSGGAVWGGDWAFGEIGGGYGAGGPSYYSELESILPNTGLNISLGP